MIVGLLREGRELSRQFDPRMIGSLEILGSRLGLGNRWLFIFSRCHGIMWIVLIANMHMSYDKSLE